jgi:hypothetical protein
MNEMSKTKTMNFYVEGPDWTQTVSLDPEFLTIERDRLIEAATLGIEKQIKNSEEMNLGAILLVRRSKTAKKEAMVNSYLCLVNAGHYKLAETLRKDFKKSSGQDLAEDKNGFSY